MNWNGRRVSVWAYAAPADLRKGFDGLSALVTNELKRSPLNGDLYLFVSGNRVRAKVLHWDGTGLCVYASGEGPLRVPVVVVGGRTGAIDDERAELVPGRQPTRWKNCAVTAGDDAVFSCCAIDLMI